MKLQNFRYAAAFSGMLLVLAAGCAAESDRVLMRRYAGHDYCHMKIETRGDPNWPADREVVDYYGHCDDRPSPRR